LQSSKIDFQGIWDNLSNEEKSVYGNDIEKLKKDFTDAIDAATKSFDKAGDAVEDFMTADMAKGFKNKLDEVAEMAGGEAAKQKVQDATDKLLEGKTKEQKQEM
jgi:hypothetical protein